MRKLILILLILLLTNPAHARTYMFSDKPSNIKSWLSSKGFEGSTFDALMGYFQSLSTLSNGTLYDHVNNVLDQHGYTGTLQDKLNQFFEAKTGVSGRDGERSFWDNTSLTFASNVQNVVFGGHNVVFGGHNVVK